MEVSMHQNLVILLWQRFEQQIPYVGGTLDNFGRRSLRQGAPALYLASEPRARFSGITKMSQRDRVQAPERRNGASEQSGGWHALARHLDAITRDLGGEV